MGAWIIYRAVGKAKADTLRWGCQIVTAADSRLFQDGQDDVSKSGAQQGVVSICQSENIQVKGYDGECRCEAVYCNDVNMLAKNFTCGISNMKMLLVWGDVRRTGGN